MEQENTPQVVDTILMKVDDNGQQSEFNVTGFLIKKTQGQTGGRAAGTPRVNVFEVTVKSNGSKTLNKLFNDAVKACSGSIDFMAGGALVDQIVFDKPTYCIGHTIFAEVKTTDDDDLIPVLKETVSFTTLAKNIKWT